MKVEDLKNLRNIKRVYGLNGCVSSYLYMYDTFIPDSDTLAGRYYPMFSKGTTIYDYTETAKRYLKKHITKSTPHDTFVYDHVKTTKCIDMANLTIEQANDIIYDNIMMFTKIQHKVAENELLDAIKAM